MNCNPISHNTRFAPAVLSCLLFFASHTAFSQGLVKLFGNYIGTNVGLLPSGNYRVASANGVGFINGNHSTRHNIAEISPDGTLLDSVEYNFIPHFAWYLTDNTFLRVQDLTGTSSGLFRFTRLSAQGDTIWISDVVVPPGAEYMEWKTVDLNAAGEIVAFCSWIDHDGNPEGLFSPVIVAKFAAGGELLWLAEHLLTPPDVHFEEPAIRIRAASDGGCLAVLDQFFAESTILLVRLNADGSLRWVVDTEKEDARDCRETSDGGWVLAGNGDVWKINDDGETLWEVDAGPIFSHPQFGPAFPMVCLPLNDGGIAVFGAQYKLAVPPFNDPYLVHLMAFKLNADGTVNWQKRYNKFIPLQTLVAKDGLQTPSGDLLWTGEFSTNTGNKTFLIRMDSNGVIFTNSLAGKVAYDETNDCTVQANEPGLPGWLLQLESGGFERYGSTDAQGNYHFSDVDTGALSLSLFIQNYLWEGCTPSIDAVVPPDSSGYTLPLDVPVRAVGDCPVMTVDLAVPFLRRCFNNTYALKCCNEGNQAATDAFVEVYLPQHLLLQGASMPYVQNGNTLTFQLGTVDPFECVDIQMTVQPDCDSTELGQAMCVSAQVYPDSICAPPPGWSGALIEVSAACDGDSVHFLIRNTGNAPMNEALDFIIIDDHVMTREGTFNLPPGAAQEESVYADGSTFRLEAEQEPNAPGAFEPSVAVEGCIPGGGPFTTGFVLQWPNENGSPFVDRDCHELVASFDPNDKQAVPRGVGDEHFIKPDVPIDYLIRFQNTGTDTAFTVVLRDTLSAHTDPASLRPGAASHPYTWSLSGAGILTVTFDNILLPDSNVNEAASHGFVQFFIRQKPDLPDFTLIENRAGIYFDFNEPVITNTVFHTVKRDFLPTVGVYTPTLYHSETIVIVPTPATGTVWASPATGNNFDAGDMTLSDAFGRTVRSWPATGAGVEIRRESLPAGVYYLRWQGAGGKTRSGKVIWK